MNLDRILDAIVKVGVPSLISVLVVIAGLAYLRRQQDQLDRSQTQLSIAQQQTQQTIDLLRESVNAEKDELHRIESELVEFRSFTHTQHHKLMLMSLETCKVAGRTPLMQQECKSFLSDLDNNMISLSSKYSLLRGELK
jgi:hypothetical protein